MQIALILFWVLGICGGFFASPVTNSRIVGEIRGLNDQFYDSYLAISDDQATNSNELDLISHSKEVYFRRPKFLVHIAQPKKMERTHLVVDTMQQRDKRYISKNYLQVLCHFKICNMGRKRTARYVHMIRELNDNDS